MFLYDSISLLAIFTVMIIFSNFIDVFIKDKIYAQLSQGFFFGIMILIALYFPLNSASPIRADGRSILLSVCTIFNGPLAGGLALIIASLGRVLQSQQGLFPGLVVLFISYIASVYFYNLIFSKKIKINFLVLFLFGFSLSFALLLVITLLNLEKINIVVDNIALFLPTIVVFYPITTAVMGYLIHFHREKNLLFETYKRTSFFFKYALYSSADSLILVDNSFKITNINRSAEILLHVSENEVIDKHVDELFKLIPFEAAEKILFKPSDIISHSESKLEKNHEKEDLRYNLTLFFRESETIPVLFNYVNIVDEQNRVLGKIIILRDYSYELSIQEDLITRERNYRELFDSVFEAILICDRDGKILNANKGTVNLLAIEKNKIIGKYINDLKHFDEKNKAKLLVAIDEVSKKISANINIEVEITNEKNEIISCYARIYQGKYYDKDIVFVLLIDVTEVKKIQKELAENLEYLERQNKAFLGRELRIIELKKEVNSLLSQFGLAPKYKDYEIEKL